MWDTAAERSDTEQGPPHSGLCVHQAVQDWCSTVPPCGAERKSASGLRTTVLSTSGISEAELRQALGFLSIQKQGIRLYNNRG